MALNSIELIVKYSTDAFDEVYKAESRSSLLDGDKKLMKFTGAKTVKIMKFSFTGLSDYRRNNAVVQGAEGNDYSGATALTSNPDDGYGYQQAAMSGEWEEFTISCDRAAQYRVELFDDEETSHMAVGMGTKEINRTIIVPEIDAYTFSKIAGYTSTLLKNRVSGDITKKPLEALNDALEYFDNNEVPPEDQVIFASPSYIKALRNTTEVTKFLAQGDFGKNVKFTIDEYEGRPIVSVPPMRFKTNIVLHKGGFGPGKDSKDIDFLIVAKSAVYHIVKYNKIKVFGPDVVQDYDGYKVNARIYHDVFVPDNKRIALYAHLKDTSTPSTTLTASIDKGSVQYMTKVTGVEVLPNGMMTDGRLYYLPLTNESTGVVKVGDTKPTTNTQKPNANSKVGEVLPIFVNEDIKQQTGTHYQILVCDPYGKVIACTEPRAKNIHE